MENYNVLNLPPKLFKYYSNDKELNAKRLLGEVYLATPLDFNDPCDCQRDVINNSAELERLKGNGWVKSKLKELGYSEEETVIMANSLINGEDTYVKVAFNRQISKAGILCLTQNHADILMWGYYAGNEGFCIEYDVNRMITSLIVGYINNLDYATTRRLYTDRRYYQIPSQRTQSIDTKLINLANYKFKRPVLKKITNIFLNEQPEELNRLNFIRNIFLKRFVAQSILYQVRPDGSPSDLFFDRNSKNIESKYFRKTKNWARENEFRIVFSLGGGQVIKLGSECIKNVYLGCNCKDNDVISFAYMLSSLNLTHISLYKMKRLKNGGLQPRLIDYLQYDEVFKKMSQLLKSI